jgi:hypothetical protein
MMIYGIEGCRRTCRMLLDIMKKQIGLTLTVGVGKCRMEMKEIPSSFDNEGKYWICGKYC